MVDVECHSRCVDTCVFTGTRDCGRSEQNPYVIAMLVSVADMGAHTANSVVAKSYVGRALEVNYGGSGHPCTTN